MAGARRTSKPLSKRLREKRNHPPKGMPWVWFSRELVESEAWRAAPINTRRVVDRIALEHMAHAGTMNGNLVVTFNDFEKWGVWRQKISEAIKDAAARGLIVVTQKGKASAGTNRWPSRYALGWLPMHDGAAATNRWKSWTKEISPSVDSSTRDTKEKAALPVHKPTPARVEESELGNDTNPPKLPSAQTPTTYKILGRGRGNGERGSHTVGELSTPRGDADATQPPPSPSCSEQAQGCGPIDERSTSNRDDPWAELEIPSFLRRHTAPNSSAFSAGGITASVD